MDMEMGMGNTAFGPTYGMAANQDPNFLQDQAQDTFEEGGLTKDSRIGFIRKVLGIVGAQLAITACMIGFSMAHKPLNDYQKSSASIWTLVVAIVAAISIMYALICYKRLARKVPGNYVLLSIFTICEAWSVSFMCIAYPPNDVFVAATATAAVVVGCFFYALFCEIDFNWVAGFLFAS